MQSIIERRFVVYDDDNLPIRKFYTKQEAINFMQQGWQLVVLPKKQVIDWDNYEPAFF